MKPIIILTLLVFISFTSCKNHSEVSEQNETEFTKTPDTNAVIKSERDPQSHSHSDPHSNLHSNIHSHDYLYKSDTGEIFEVTFFEADDTMQVKIKRDNQVDLILDLTTAWSKGAEYEKGDYKWTSRNNDGTFSDGKETMNLVVISPLQYTFTNTKEDIVIIYFSRNDKMFVSIQKDNKTQITLEQTSAWAKGAEYGKDAIKWRGDGSKGVLIEDGVETQYNQKD